MKKQLLIAFLFLQLISISQVKVWLKFGDEALQEGDYYGASKFFQKACLEDSSKTEITYKLGLAFKGYHNYKNAKKEFLKIKRSQELQALYPDFRFHLGDIYKGLAEYDSSTYYYEQYLKSRPSPQLFTYQKARAEVKNAEQVKRLFNDTVDVEIKNIGNKVNTGVAEFNGVYIHDSVLLFSALKADKIGNDGVIEDEHYAVKLYTANYKDSVWQNVALVKLKSNLQHYLDGCWFKDEFYFSGKTEDGAYEIYKTSLHQNKKGKWTLDSPSVVIGNVGEEAFNYRNPFVFESLGKKTMIFSSDKERGKGKMDLWYIQQRRGAWGNPKNMGNKINTPGNEVGPFVHPKNDGFYFASDFHYNLGGFDIFTGEGFWKRPTRIKNMGLPFNTAANDLYLNFKDSISGSLTSGRVGSYTEKDAICCNDLYTFEYPPPPKKKDTIITTPEEVMERLQKLVEAYHVTLYFHNDRPNPRTRDTITPYNYLTTYEAYVDSIPTYYYRNTLGKADTDSLAAIDKIQGFFDEYVHKGVEDLAEFTKALLSELELGQKILLTVKGYASPLAKSDYNVNLTLRRINSLENYLAEYAQGILLPYLNDSAQNGGLLKIKKVPFGEYRSDTTVSDNYYNTKQSVYSKEASLERKIEIINLTLLEDSIDNGDFIFNLDSSQVVYDLGVLDTNVFEWRINLQNLGVDTMQIESIDLGCHCLNSDRSSWEISPKETEPLDIQFNLKGYSGKLGRKVVLKLDDGTEKTIILLMEVPERLDEMNKSEN